METMNTNKNDSGTLKFSKPTPNFPKGGEEIKDGEFVSSVKEETKVKRPDFNEWILTEEGKKCNDFSSLTGRAYLQNRLFWAFDAGRNCIWDQFQETKKENQELKARLKISNEGSHINGEILEALEAAMVTIKAFLPDAFATLNIIESAINKAKGQ